MNALIQITILNNCIVAQSKLKTGNKIRNLFPAFEKI